MTDKTPPVEPGETPEEKRSLKDKGLVFMSASGDTILEIPFWLIAVIVFQITGAVICYRKRG